MQLVSVDEAREHVSDRVDLLVIGGPTERWAPKLEAGERERAARVGDVAGRSPGDFAAGEARQGLTPVTGSFRRPALVWPGAAR